MDKENHCSEEVSPQATPFLVPTRKGGKNRLGGGADREVYRYCPCPVTLLPRLQAALPQGPFPAPVGSWLHIESINLPVSVCRKGGNKLKKLPFPKSQKRMPHLRRGGREGVKGERGLHCGSKAHNALPLTDFFGYFLVQQQESTAPGRVFPHPQPT